MGLTTLSNVSANLQLDGDDDIIDFTRLIDPGLLIDLDNKTINENFSFVGYENIIGGLEMTEIIHLNSNDLQTSYGIVGGQGHRLYHGI